MRSFRRFLYTQALALTFVSLAAASQIDYKLLALVPPGAEIVAGFENHPDPHHHGQLLLTTHADRLDLEDFIAITGADPQRGFDEVVEVAASPAGEGNLSEHLLLVEGRFDTGHIFKAAETNGSSREQIAGHTVMVIKPFSREKGDMIDTRWLAILQNRIGLFGTPCIILRALERYATHVDIDMALRERLSGLRHDVSSWNILVQPSNPRRKILLRQGNPWAPLLDDAKVLMVGTRFGPKVRVDFSMHLAEGRKQDLLKEKTACFARVFQMEMLASVHQRRLENVLIDATHVEASLHMSRSQFDAWIEQAKHPSVPPQGSLHPISRGE